MRERCRHHHHHHHRHLYPPSNTLQHHRHHHHQPPPWWWLLLTIMVTCKAWRVLLIGRISKHDACRLFFCYSFSFAFFFLVFGKFCSFFFFLRTGRCFPISFFFRFGNFAWHLFFEFEDFLKSFCYLESSCCFFSTSKDFSHLFLSRGNVVESFDLNHVWMARRARLRTLTCNNVDWMEKINRYVSG